MIKYGAKKVIIKMANGFLNKKMKILMVNKNLKKLNN